MSNRAFHDDTLKMLFDGEALRQVDLLEALDRISWEPELFINEHMNAFSGAYNMAVLCRDLVDYWLENKAD